MNIQTKNAAFWHQYPFCRYRQSHIEKLSHIYNQNEHLTVAMEVLRLFSKWIKLFSKWIKILVQRLNVLELQSSIFVQVRLDQDQLINTDSI